MIAFGFPGTPELLIFMGIIVLLFGSAKLPSLMRNMGRSINEFKAGMKDPTKHVEDHSEPAEKDRSVPTPEEEKVG